ncbi:NlpC/P60 family protein, partial [Mycobacterium sp. NAZ190054]|uniref:NlpC/P60 family protein n=1 Tax=Mycobacterium sp. NAZ190054 TaxID=1747766 RepID=UPI001E4F364C
MFAIATLLTLVNQVSGTPYVSGGDSPAGTDCSGLVSWVTNAATGRPVYGDRFHTGNIESALLARGFQYGTQPGALVVGWNRGHTAVTLPDGTPVSSDDGGLVAVEVHRAEATCRIRRHRPAVLSSPQFPTSFNDPSRE